MSDLYPGDLVTVAGRTYRVAMDTEVARWEAIRQTVNCPTCKDWLPHPADTSIYKAGCPDCTDGKIDMARLLAWGAAVAAEPMTNWPHEGYATKSLALGHDTLLAKLRAVRP